jgi:hypothetical protein
VVFLSRAAHTTLLVGRFAKGREGCWLGGEPGEHPTFYQVKVEAHDGPCRFSATLSVGKCRA